MESQNRESRLDRVERMLASQAELNAQFAEQHKAAMARIEAERVRSDQEHRDAMARIKAETVRSDQEHRDAMARIEVPQVNIESLHSSASELHAVSQKWEPLTRVVAELVEAARRDGENIAARARIAAAHERRLDDIQGSGN